MPIVCVDVVEGKIFVQSPFELRDMMKSIPTHKWDKARKMWTFDARSGDAVTKLMQHLQALEGTYKIESTLTAQELFARHGEAVARLMDGIRTVGAIKDDSYDLSKIVMPIKTAPFEHQKKAFAIGTTLDASALFMEMGTGKTLTAIAVAGKRYLDGQIKKLLVIAPLSVLDVWGREFRKHAAFQYSGQVLRPDDPKIHKKADGLQVVVTNYDALVGRNGKSAVFKAIERWSPEMVILDESQRIKNREAKRSQAIHQFGAPYQLHFERDDECEDSDAVPVCTGVRYKMILTGTPVTQNALDLWSQYHFLDRRIFGDNYYRFRAKYAIMGGWEGKEVIGYKNLDDLSQTALQIAYRVTKEEALDLPEFTDEFLYVDLDDDTRKAYEQMRNEARLVIEGLGKTNAPAVLTQLLRLAQISGGFITMKDEHGHEGIKQIGNEKLCALAEFVEDFPAEKKLVIFCRFLAEIDAIASMLNAAGIPTEILIGETKNRGDLIDRFQNGHKPRVLVVQIATGGLGIDLHRADTVIFYSFGYSLADYEQARARVHRIGQQNKVTYVHLVAKNTVDHDIMDALATKGDVAAFVVDRIVSPFYDEEDDVMMVKYRK